MLPFRATFVFLLTITGLTACGGGASPSQAADNPPAALEVFNLMPTV